MLCSMDITAGIDVARMQHTRRIGIQCANSSGCADSNAVVAAKSGVMHIQGSFLGTGPNGNISLAVTSPICRSIWGTAVFPI